jgi:hypothetical protein
MEISINYLAVGLAVIANFVLGWLWYTPLFGKAWAKEMKLDTSEKPKTGLMLRGMLFMVIGNFLTAYVIAHDVFAWSLVPGMADMGSDMGPVLMTSFFIWLGYYVPTHIGATTWERRSWKLTLINLGYHFATLFVAALIIIKMG